MDFLAAAQLCAPNVHVQAMYSVVQTESSFNQFAIGTVGGHLKRQPRSLAEAIATAEDLQAHGVNFSLGWTQVNVHNLARNGLTITTAFAACQNVRAGANELAMCFKNAKKQIPGDQEALRAAISCYYTGNFLRGFRPDKPGDTSYVDKVLRNSLKASYLINRNP